MERKSETVGVKSESTKESNESTSTLENPAQEQNKEAVENKAIKQTESSENEADLKGTNQQKGGSTESSQQKFDPAEFSQEKKGPTKSSLQSPNSRKSSQKRLKFTESMQRYRRSGTEPKARKVEVSESVRQIVIWTMTGFFHFNPRYFLQVRGLTNIMHIGLSLTDVILLSLICQLQIFPQSTSEGFYCKPPETFLFIVACSALLTSVLYLVSCVLSKSTDVLLFQSSFEVSYFVLYFILLLTASLTLIVSKLSWGTDEEVYENDYESTQVAAIVGLVNSIMYGISAIWFFLSHRLYQNDADETEDQS